MFFDVNFVFNEDIISKFNQLLKYIVSIFRIGIIYGNSATKTSLPFTGLEISLGLLSIAVAQPSLSQQIKTMELELGSPLFHRQGRKVILTESGEALLPRAEKILEEHKNAKEAVNDISQRGGRIQMGAILSIAPI